MPYWQRSSPVFQLASLLLILHCKQDLYCALMDPLIENDTHVVHWVLSEAQTPSFVCTFFCNQRIFKDAFQLEGPPPSISAILQSSPSSIYTNSHFAILTSSRTRIMEAEMSNFFNNSIWHVVGKQKDIYPWYAERWVGFSDDHYMKVTKICEGNGPEMEQTKGWPAAMQCESLTLFCVTGWLARGKLTFKLTSSLLVRWKLATRQTTSRNCSLSLWGRWRSYTRLRTVVTLHHTSGSLLTFTLLQRFSCTSCSESHSLPTLHLASTLPSTKWKTKPGISKWPWWMGGRGWSTSTSCYSYQDLYMIVEWPFGAAILLGQVWMMKLW